jgi:hypothetical protein
MKGGAIGGVLRPPGSASSSGGASSGGGGAVGAGSGGGATTVRAPFRRQSVRDVALEEALHAGDPYYTLHHSGANASGGAANAGGPQSPNIVTGQNPMASRRKMSMKPLANTSVRSNFRISMMSFICSECLKCVVTRDFF